MVVLYIILVIMLCFILIAIVIMLGIYYFNWDQKLEIKVRKIYSNTNSPFIKARVVEIKDKKIKDKHNKKKLINLNPDNRASRNKNVY